MDMMDGNAHNTILFLLYVLAYMHFRFVFLRKAL